MSDNDNKNISSGFERPVQEAYQYRENSPPSQGYGLYFQQVPHEKPTFASPLHQAAAQGDLAKVTQLCEEALTSSLSLRTEVPPPSSGPSLSASGINNSSSGSTSSEAKIKQETPLHLAIEYGFSYRFRYLMTEYSKKYQKMSSLEKRQEPSFEAITTENKEIANRNLAEIIAKLLEHGIDIHAVDESGWNALHLAAKNGDADVMSQLINADASIEQTNDAGNTALHLAIYHGHADAVELLLQNNASLNVPNQSKQTPLMLALDKIQQTQKSIKGTNKKITPDLDRDRKNLKASYQRELAALERLKKVLSTIIEKSINETTDFFTADDRGRTVYDSLTPTLRVHTQVKTHIINELKALLQSNREKLTTVLAKYPELGALPSDHDEPTFAQLLASAADNLFLADAQGNMLYSRLSAAQRVQLQEKIATQLKQILYYNQHTLLDNILTKHPELISHTDTQGNTLLHLASKYDHDVTAVTQCLIRHKASLNTLNTKGKTALDMSMNSDNTEGTLALAQAGALSHNDDTLLRILIAKYTNDHSLINHIKSVLATPGIAIDAKNAQGQTALTLAIETNASDVAKRIIPKTTDADRIANLRIIIAKESYDAELAAAIVTSLSKEAIEQNIDLINLAIHHKRRDLVNALVEKLKADTETKLMYAIKQSRLDLINVLAPQATDKDRMTCLRHIIETEPYNDDMAKAILKHISREAVQESSLLHLAVTHGRIALIDSLVAHGADVNKANAQGKTALHLACSLGHADIVTTLANYPGTTLSATDKAGNTALHVAADKLRSSEHSNNGDHADPQEAIIATLVDKFANIRLKNIAGKTALHIAAEKGSRPVVEKLLDAGGLEQIQIREHDKDNNTPLHLAAKSQNTNLVKLLLRKGADPQARNNTDKRPIELASTNETRRLLAQQDLIAALENHKLLLQKELQARFGFFARYSVSHDYKNNKQQKIAAIDALLTHLRLPATGAPTDLNPANIIDALRDGRTGDILREYGKDGKHRREYYYSNGCWPEALKKAVQTRKAALAHSLRNAISKW